MSRELTSDITWIHECYDHGDAHEHVSVYLIEESEGYIIVDTGSFYHRERITREIKSEIGDKELRAIILSHSDYPHSANVGAFRDEWDDIEVFASCGSPAAQGLGTATKCNIGSSMDIIGRSFSFIDPPLADRSHTAWIFDHETNALFAADGFGTEHREGQCSFTSREFEEGIPEEQIYRFHRDTLVWLRYVDPIQLRSALESILDEFGVEMICPVHGNPIIGTDIDRYLDRLTSAADRISDEYDVERPKTADD
ncbi:MBL fold metallo-hydrolase [Natrinema sp. 1APR25-10V2]|uniref:MBL fold metallo-hydrolase n=1 Tax=Natrinema sp. 1APR25-10V2 TaxID=2951081 RepID=UPI0028765E05|nr:MBL fold metallo-hydrolase [Natrinema sp. 1APR25-10V2]MDS0476933.1 MBL fold metallo-hydrolase [Natrinema sp. 1APR25-10V2]